MLECNLMPIDYSKSMFYFVGTRKHFFKDQTYHIYIFANKIIMGQTMRDPSPKYSIQLTLSYRIGWVLLQKNQNMVLSAFQFSDGRKEKDVYANPECLERMKELIASKVTFQKISDFYEPQFNIGSGSSAKVIQCQRLSDNKLFAIKAIQKEYLRTCDGGMSALRNEVLVLQQLTQLIKLDQRHFLQLIEVFEGDLTYYLVTELMQGETLQTEMRHFKEQQEFMPSDQVKTIMLQLLKGVSILHKSHIIHRDLKPDNIMFEKVGQIKTLKIVDFGLATHKDVKKFQYRKCGTPGYVAPEILNLKQNSHSYSELCDVFSCGIIFYKLLSNRSCFRGLSIDEVLRKNSKCQINFYNNDIIHIDQPERELLQAMLQKDPSQRVTAESALQFDYFGGKINKSTESQSTYIRMDQQSEVSPVLIPQNMILMNLNEQEIQQKQINHSQTRDEDASPFYKMIKKKDKQPLFFSQYTYEADLIIEDNKNQHNSLSKSSLNSMDEHRNTDQVRVQRISVSKHTSIINQLSKPTIKVQSQNEYQAQLGHKNEVVLIKLGSSQQIISNRSSLANITSFYMKDPLQNLLKHLQNYSKQFASSDNSPQNLDQDQNQT